MRSQVMDVDIQQAWRFLHFLMQDWVGVRIRDIVVGDVAMQDEGEYEGRRAVADDDSVNTVR